MTIKYFYRKATNIYIIIKINSSENGIPIESWYEDKNDKCLKELIPVFDKISY